MLKRHQFVVLPQTVAMATILALYALPAAADTQAGVTDLGTVTTQAAGAEQASNSTGAPSQAVTQAPLSATEPKSVISRDVIQNTDTATANYSDIIAIAPSVITVDPNGPGLMESQAGGPIIRGFQDGQYNVIFDGIPWGDSNDFTHHTTSYFMPQDLNAVTVDRGPGNASTIGNATFGGTIALQSKAPLNTPTTTLYGTTGSWGTNLLGVQYDTGTNQNYGDMRAFIDYRKLQSDGYLSGAGLQRSNLFMKAEKPIGDNTLLTFVTMQNSLVQHYSIGETSYPYVAQNSGQPPFTSNMPGQLQVFGPRYGLSNNPASQNYAGYNYDDITTDFEYIGLKTSYGDVQVDNKVYTYAYNHRGYFGQDPQAGNYSYGAVSGPSGSAGDGTFPAGLSTANGTVNGAANVPGGQMSNIYRSVGDVLRLSQHVGTGELRYGLWYDRQGDSRDQYYIDWSDNLAFNPQTPGVPSTEVDHSMNDTLESAQPYIEYAWNITPDLVLTPGVKYDYFRRHIDAEINQKTGGELDFSKTWTKALPSVDLHYTINPNWTAYAQAAEGFLAPNLNVFYVNNPSVSDQGLEPESTKNYQLGTVWQTHRLSLSADIYDITFSNQVTSKSFAGIPTFVNLGGTHYHGAEGEATYYLGNGISAYGNLTYNIARQNSTGLQLAGVSKFTSAAGLLYKQGGIDGSLLAKHVGGRYGDQGTDANGNPMPIYHFNSYTMVDAALNYTTQEKDYGLPKGTKVGVQVSNLFNKTPLYALSTYTINGVPLFFTLPGRGVFVNFAVPF